MGAIYTTQSQFSDIDHKVRSADNYVRKRTWLSLIKAATLNLRSSAKLAEGSFKGRSSSAGPPMLTTKG